MKVSAAYKLTTLLRVLECMKLLVAAGRTSLQSGLFFTNT
jgi:hypothetical protein